MFPGDSQSLFQIPRLGGLMCCLEPSIVIQNMGCPPSGYGIWFYHICAPPNISLGLLLCLWMWNIFFFFCRFQHPPVDGCSTASCDFGALAEEMSTYLFILQSWTRTSWQCVLYLKVYKRVDREGNGTPLQRSCLENPKDGGAWWVAVYGVARSQIRLKLLSRSKRVEFKNSHHKKKKVVTMCGNDLLWWWFYNTVSPWTTWGLGYWPLPLKIHFIVGPPFL